MLPFVALLFLAFIQVGVVVRAQILVTHVAREAARAAAVDARPEAAREAAAHATTLDPARLTVTVRGRDGPGSRVVVHVECVVDTDVPLAGAFVGDVTLEAEATMRVE